MTDALLPDAPITTEMPMGFVLSTAPREGHPHPAYTHRCDVTLFGKPMWSAWGKSPEDAEDAARFQISSRVRQAFGV